MKRQVSPEELSINVKDTALIFEGGGMRAAYTAPVVAALIREGINFADVYGISAGSSHVTNYVSRDEGRARACFVDLAEDPKCGGIKYALQGKGFFNSTYLYEDIPFNHTDADDPWSLDWETFQKNPVRWHIDAFDWESGQTRHWTNEDAPDMKTFCRMIKASSSLPVFMNPAIVNGRTYLDGGLGDSWGIALNSAKRDGYERFFIVRTQKRGYRKKPSSPISNALMKAAFHKHPSVAQATAQRPEGYNAVCDEIDRLEEAGKALVFYPETMDVNSRELNYEKLARCYDLGEQQVAKELDNWKRWLGLEG